MQAIMDRLERPLGTHTLLNRLTPNGRAEFVVNMFIALLVPMTGTFEEAIRRAGCLENMQRLVLAILLYQLEHGQLPGENWVTDIKPYLGEEPERFFSCPTNPSPDGQTTYALVQYGDNLPDSSDTILLVELTMPVPFDQAVVSVNDVLAHQAAARTPGNRSHRSAHLGGMNVASRSAAVRFLPAGADEEEVKRLLGQ